MKTKSINSTTITFTAAVKALHKARANRGIPLEEPSESSSDIVQSAKPTWYLRSERGLLGKVDAVSEKVHADCFGDEG